MPESEAWMAAETLAPGGSAEATGGSDAAGRRRSTTAGDRSNLIFEAVGFAAKCLRDATNWRNDISEVMRRVGEATAVTRVCVVENRLPVDGTPRSNRFEWSAAKSAPTLASHEDWSSPFRSGFERWDGVLSSGEAIHGPAWEFPESERDELASEGILSLAVVPIFVGDDWWGYLRLDDHLVPRQWSDFEIEAFRIVANVLGVAVGRERAEGRYRELIEQIPVAVYVSGFGSDGIWTLASPRIKELTGFAAEEWIANPRLWYERLHPDDRERLMQDEVETLDSVVRGGDVDAVSSQEEFRIIRKDGSVVWIHDKAEVIRDAKGEPLHWLGVWLDITQRKRMEEELDRALRSEHEVTEHLSALDQLKNLQLHAVSHDLRDPITAIVGSALVLQQDEAGNSSSLAREMIEAIVRSGRKLHRLVEALLDLDRLEQGILEPNRQSCDLAQVIRNVVSELAETTHPIAIEAEPTQAFVDPVLADRILENLITNAMKHTSSGTQIWVKAKRHQTGVILVVEDSGPGIPVELREVIFEPFRRGEAGPGLGIGLSLVAGFAKLHGGWAKAGEREGGGASFQVFLDVPRAEMDESRSDRVTRPLPAPEEVTSAGVVYERPEGR